MKARAIFRRILGSLGLLLPVILLLTLRALLPWETWLQPALAWLGGAGWWGMVVAAALYVPLGLFLVPASALTILVGVAHGFWAGLACVTLGANLAAWAAFGLARLYRVGFKPVHGTEKRLLSRINERGVRSGFWLVTLARLSVFVPYGPLNYLLGFSGMRFRDYALGTFFGMLPGSALYLWAGNALANESASPVRNLLVILGLVSSSLLLALVGQIARLTILEGNRPENGPAVPKGGCRPKGPDQVGSGVASNSAITTS